MRDFARRFVALFERLHQRCWSTHMIMSWERVVGRFPFDDSGNFSVRRGADEHSQSLKATYVAIIFLYGTRYPRNQRNLRGLFQQQCASVLICLGLPFALANCDDHSDRFTIWIEETEAVYSRLPPLLPELMSGKQTD